MSGAFWPSFRGTPLDHRTRLGVGGTTHLVSSQQPRPGWAWWSRRDELFAGGHDGKDRRKPSDRATEHRASSSMRQRPRALIELISRRTIVPARKIYSRFRVRRTVAARRLILAFGRILRLTLTSVARAFGISSAAAVQLLPGGEPVVVCTCKSRTSVS